MNKLKLWNLKCISRQAFLFREYDCTISPINNINKKSPNLHFHFLLQEKKENTSEI